MADQSEHVQKLIAARAQLVTTRRQLADALREDYKRGHTENMREQFVNVQNTIEAVDRAIADERSETRRPG